MVKYITILLFTVMGSMALARQMPFDEKVIIDEHDELTGYYLVKKPDQIDHVLILMPGFGQYPESIFAESGLPRLASKNNTMILAFAGGRKIYADTAVVRQMNKIINHAKLKFQLAHQDFAIGGFSAGGTLALRYTELCFEKPGSFPIKPKAIFTVDSPIDLFALWGYLQNEIKKNYSEVGVNEAKFVTQIITDEHGAVPGNTLIYEKLTPFHAGLEESGNEKYLMGTAVRVYHDVDVAWQLKNRRRSVYDANFLPASGLINTLLLNGHTNAEFVQGETGYRSNGMRHPHSWSIVNEEECIKWLDNAFRN